MPKRGFPLVWANGEEGESGANLQEYRGLSENASVLDLKQCAQGMEGKSYPRQASNSLVVLFPGCWVTLALLCETHPHLSALLLLPKAR